jgi:hypothetical protein
MGDGKEGVRPGRDLDLKRGKPWERIFEIDLGSLL